MSITSRCNGCGATSLGGILQHVPSCLAGKSDIRQHNIMPSITVTFDSPEDQKKFASKLQTSNGSGNVPKINQAAPKDREELRKPPKGHDLEMLAMNIVHQIGDALYEAMPQQVAHDYFVDARQATNDIAIDFAKKLIDAYTTRAVGEAEDRLVEWLEADLKRLDSRNWTMDTIALDTLVHSGKADDYQKSKRQEIVEDRRAAHALYAILANYKKHRAALPKDTGEEGQ